MARSGTRDLSVGAMLALALIVLAVSVMAIGDGRQFFGGRSLYNVTFPTTDGLVIGSPVKMAGVQIGSVSRIELSMNPQEPGIRVELNVDQNYAGRVREDSGAALRILQLLSGEKFVEIIPGTPDSELLASGGEIRPIQDPELLKQAAVAAENLNDITVSLKNLLVALESGDGLIGQMINDPQFGRSGMDALAGSMENLRALTADLLTGEGFIGRMLYDDSFAGRIDDLGNMIQGLERLVSSLSFEEGAIGELLQADGKGQQMVDDLAAAAASLNRLMASLENGNGLLSKLIFDEAYSETLAADLGRILSNTAEITEKINNGEGTLGALVNERELHTALEQVVVGVNDSKFARWLMRRYQKKGIKATDEKAEE